MTSDFMMKFETIRTEVDARGVANITLARAKKHNAMNATMIAELTQVCAEIGNNENIRVCVLQAEGQTFCAGGDLKWMQAQMIETRDEKIAGAMRLASMLEALDNLACPLIGKIQGPAYGGGIGLMAVCDVVIASKGTKFALTETKLGLIPATIGPFVIRRIGEPWARQYFFSTKTFDAAKAREMNLVSQVVEHDNLDQAVDREIETTLHALPGAVRAAKSLAKKLARNPTMETKAYTAEKLAERWESEEAQNAIEAFFAPK